MLWFFPHKTVYNEILKFRGTLKHSHIKNFLYITKALKQDAHLVKYLISSELPREFSFEIDTWGPKKLSAGKTQ